MKELEIGEHAIIGDQIGAAVGNCVTDAVRSHPVFRGIIIPAASVVTGLYAGLDDDFADEMTSMMIVKAENYGWLSFWETWRLWMLPADYRRRTQHYINDALGEFRERSVTHG